MAAPIAKIETFENSVELWPTYYERLEQYYLANDVPDANQMLLERSKPATTTFAQLTEILCKHLSPKPLVITERFRFHKRDNRKAKLSRNMLHTLESCQNIVNSEATLEILFDIVFGMNKHRSSCCQRET